MSRHETTIKGAAAHAGVSLSTVYAAIKRGNLAVFQVNGKKFIRSQSLQAWIAMRQPRATPAELSGKDLLKATLHAISEHDAITKARQLDIEMKIDRLAATLVSVRDRLDDEDARRKLKKRAKRAARAGRYNGAGDEYRDE